MRTAQESQAQGGGAATSLVTPLDTGDASDDELTVLALAADPETDVEDDAISLWTITGYDSDRRLPAWYMPAPMGGRLVVGWRRRVILLVIASFVVINAYGLCSTYGRVGFG